MWLQLFFVIQSSKKIAEDVKLDYQSHHVCNLIMSEGRVTALGRSARPTVTLQLTWYSRHQYVRRELYSLPGHAILTLIQPAGHVSRSDDWSSRRIGVSKLDGRENGTLITSTISHPPHG